MRGFSASGRLVPLLLLAALARAAPVTLHQAVDRLAAEIAREVVFVERRGGSAYPGGDGHWYANFGHYATSSEIKAYREGARLCALDLVTGKVRILLHDPQGTLRDPAVHYDGERLVFSYRKGGTPTFHLYTLNLDGTGLRQLTDGRYDDIEPAWLPDDSLVFCSGRARRFVQCWHTQVATLHRCDPDGGRVRPISANVEHDNTPWPLPDGRILFMRWEYVDRSQVHYHHLWTCNPDGTGHQVFFGNYHPGGVYIDAKPVPGSNKIVFSNSPGHGYWEHYGHIAQVSPERGPDDLGALRNITPKPDFADPWAFSEELFMAARYKQLVFLNAAGEERVVHTAPENIHEPRPVMRRLRERLLPERTDPAQTTGTLVLQNVYAGRNMAGVAPGEIRSLLLLESLPLPIHYSGGMEPVSVGGTFTLERLLGTVPVAPDGSACFTVPANRPIILVALDARDAAVKRMHSFLSVAPGETLGCVGCHEPRTQAPPPAAAPHAPQRAPVAPRPVAGVPEILDFPRDIQPLLTRHCAACHNADRRAGGLSLDADRGPLWLHSYVYLSWRNQLGDNRNRPKSDFPPRAIGDAASGLMRKIETRHHEVSLSPEETRLVRFWLHAGAPYCGTTAAIGSGMIGSYENNRTRLNDRHLPSANWISEVVGAHCAACHNPRKSWLPTHVSEGHRREILFNLTRPEKSLLLRAPLAKEHGGLASMPGAGGQPVIVFKSTEDFEYRKLLQAITDVAELLRTYTSFEMPDFKPRPSWLREMKRHGILPYTYRRGEPIDVYAVDRRYFESFWHVPDGAPPPARFDNPFPYPGIELDNETRETRF